MELWSSLLIKKRIFLEKVILLIFFISCAKSEFSSLEDSTTTYNPVTTSQDLNDWTVINGSWTISGDGSSATQSSHNSLKPFLLVSATTYTNVILSGTVNASSSDDDMFGWVMGLNSPTSSSDTDYSFILMDWKKADQTSSGVTGREGHCLSKVNGSFSGSTDMLNYFFGRTDTGVGGKFNVLNTNYGSSEGWAQNTSYNFEISYTESKVKVAIGDKTIFEESGSFSSGKVGFYMYSQDDVTFSNISLTTDFDPSSI